MGDTKLRNVEVKMRVCSPDIPVWSVDFTILITVQYSLLLGGQRRCGFKTCPRLLHIFRAAGIEPQNLRSQVQHLNHSATLSTKKNLYYLCLLPQGHMALSRPRDDGCQAIEDPPTEDDPWIVLIKRGDCDFDVKVRACSNSL